jgi:dTDP-4-amino-4,6-dideoxygalactose transaminase
MIPFNKPYLTGKETDYIRNAVKTGKISGNGIYTQMCQHFFENKYGFNKCLLITSCTDAREMAAILADIKPGDEVIVPSFNFVSKATVFVRQGDNKPACSLYESLGYKVDSMEYFYHIWR